MLAVPVMESTDPSCNALASPRSPPPSYPRRASTGVVSTNISAQSSPARGPRTTTFAPLPAAGSSSEPSPLKASDSLLNRLGRKLSQSKSSKFRSKSPGARSDTVQEEGRQTDSGIGESGLKRGLRALGRSKSEGRRRSWLEARQDKPEMRAASRDRSQGDHFDDTQSRLYWEERIGASWRDEDTQEFTPYPFPAYTSDSDVVIPRIVYASALSSFAPRAPLRHAGLPEDAPLLPITLTPANQIIVAYNESCRLRDAALLEAKTPERITTSKVATLTPPPHSPDIQQAGSTNSGASGSDASSSSSLRSRLRIGRDSADSDTSVESSPHCKRRGEDRRHRAAVGGEGSTPSPPPVGPRFSLVDNGPVDIPTTLSIRIPAASSQGWKSATGKSTNGTVIEPSPRTWVWSPFHVDDIATQWRDTVRSSVVRWVNEE